MAEMDAGRDGLSPSLPAALVAVRARCLDWVDGTLGYFDPRTAAPRDRLYAQKSFAELCLAAFLLLRFEGPSAVPPGVAALIRTVCADPDFIQGARQNPFGVLAYVYPALLDHLLRAAPEHRNPARRPGQRSDAELFRLVAGILISPALLSTERAPHRIADILFGRWLFTGLQSDQRALRQPWCVSNGEYLPHAAVNSLEDFYAYTHNVFYIAGFGLFEEQEQDRAPREPDRQRTQGQRPAGYPAGLRADGQDFAIWRFVAEGNWDIALELVMTQLLLRQGATAGSVAVLARLLGDAETLGYLVGPPPRPAAGTARLSPAAMAWQRHYHTTLLGVIGCTLALRPWARPFLGSLARVDTACSMGALLASGKLLSDVQHRRRTGKRELRSRLAAIASSAPLKEQLDRYLGGVAAEFRTWQR